MKILAAGFFGLVFAFGLGISGMTLPKVVLGFLDVTGDWNPALLGVMFSATLVFGITYWLRRGRTPWLGGRPPNPSPTHFDARLIVGASLFGIGWGLAGVCPGPAITNLGSPTSGGIVLVLGIVAGMFLLRIVEHLMKPRRQPVAGS